MVATLTSTDIDKDRCPRCGVRIGEPIPMSQATKHRDALTEIVALQDRSFVSGEGLFMRALTIARAALKT